MDPFRADVLFAAVLLAEMTLEVALTPGLGDTRLRVWLVCLVQAVGVALRRRATLIGAALTAGGFLALMLLVPERQNTLEVPWFVVLIGVYSVGANTDGAPLRGRRGAHRGAGDRRGHALARRGDTEQRRLREPDRDRGPAARRPRDPPPLAAEPGAARAGARARGRARRPRGGGDARGAHAHRRRAARRRGARAERDGRAGLRRAPAGAARPGPRAGGVRVGRGHRARRADRDPRAARRAAARGRGPRAGAAAEPAPTSRRW